MIGIINYGCGNLGSIENMLQYLDIKAMIISEPEDIKKMDKLILPGVGSYLFGINNLRSSGFIEPLNNSVLVEKTPILGICLGMQLMTNRSEEGDANGLGWIDADTIKFENRPNFNVPHMGWNYVHDYEMSPVFTDIPSKPKFYFVHSYFVKCKKKENILCTTHYYEDFVSGIHSENIFGIQFHPEKSHKFGMKIFENFNKL